MALKLPQHLRRYIVEQNYERYTPIDHAVWRYVLRQLKSFLSSTAHECYLEGLEKTGIEIERIPKIEDISAKIEKFGWIALPVSGFIPPAAFMELQSLSILPIASDLRTIDHLMYTPAPDIVHEAAGHAPILVHPDFAHYLKSYAQVAKKAIISKEDLDLYEAIRELSDTKENPLSSENDIRIAEDKLNIVSQSMTHVSEASELSRMNWWTAEYGLIGEINHPKIFGAGLLSSMGESQSCLKEQVKKIPLSIDCLKVSYDITNPQPQLFVAKDFKHLSEVLEEMAKSMAFRVGGIQGIQKAIKAQTVNTIELDTGIQISGVVQNIITNDKSEIIFAKLSGPSQLSYKDNELPGHHRQYHRHGYSTPIGFLKNNLNQCLSQYTKEDLEKAQLIVGEKTQLEFASGILLSGRLQQITRRDHKILLFSFSECSLQYQGQTLFDPSWGIFDMAVGTEITSVFGGPADREAYGEIEDFVVKKVPQIQFSEEQKSLHRLYQKIRDLRESKESGLLLEKQLREVLNLTNSHFSQDWLLYIEIYELLKNRCQSCQLLPDIENRLAKIKNQQPQLTTMVDNGLKLASQL